MDLYNQSIVDNFNDINSCIYFLLDIDPSGKFVSPKKQY